MENNLYMGFMLFGNSLANGWYSAKMAKISLRIRIKHGIAIDEAKPFQFPAIVLSLKFFTKVEFIEQINMKSTQLNHVFLPTSAVSFSLFLFRFIRIKKSISSPHR